MEIGSQVLGAEKRSSCFWDHFPAARRRGVACDAFQARNSDRSASGEFVGAGAPS
jgi:hypothetical protein